MDSKSETVTVALPGPEMTVSAQTLLQQAQSYVIDGPEMFEAASEDLRAIVTKKKELTEQRLNITRPLDDTKKRIMALFNAPISFLENAETIIKRGLRKYSDEQEEARREQERQQRAALAEEQKRLADEAAAQETERRRLEAEALAAEKAGKPAEAERLQQEAETVAVEQSATLEAAASLPTSIVSSIEEPKAAGVSFTETWRAEVYDLKALVKAVAEGKVPLACLEANMKVMNSQAKSLKNQMEYPGVKAVMEKTVSARRV